MKLMISAAVRIPPTGLLLMFSLPDSRSVSTSLSSRKCRGLYAFERGDAQQYVVAQLLGELSQNFACLVAVEMHQDGGDNLGMLAPDQFRHRGRIHPFEAFYAAGVAAFENAADDIGGLFFPELR